MAGLESYTVNAGPVFEQGKVRRDNDRSEFALVSHDGGLGHQHVGLQSVLNRLGRDELPAGGLEQVFLSVCDGEKAVAVDFADVAGFKPAIDKGGAGFFRQLPVAFEDRGAFDHDLAIVGDLYLERIKNLSYGADLECAAAVDGQRWRSLGQAV